MLLVDLATTSSALATTRSRLAKRALLVDLLRRTPPEDVGIVSRYLGGQLRQRRTGLGWRSLTSLPTPASEPSLTVAGVDAVFEQMSRLEGPGSVISRNALAAELFGAATADEQRLLGGLVTGELRQGSLDALLLDAVAEAAGVPPEVVRRAAMLAGDTEPVAVAALTSPDPVAALAALHARRRAARAADAGAVGAGRGRCLGEPRAGSGGRRLEARRHPHPGPPPGSTTCACSRGASTTSPRGCRRSSRRSGRCRRRTSCSTARRSPSARTVARDRSRRRRRARPPRTPRSPP